MEQRQYCGRHYRLYLRFAQRRICGHSHNYLHAGLWLPRNTHGNNHSSPRFHIRRRPRLHRPDIDSDRCHIWWGMDQWQHRHCNSRLYERYRYRHCIGQCNYILYYRRLPRYSNCNGKSHIAHWRTYQSVRGNLNHAHRCNSRRNMEQQQYLGCHYQFHRRLVISCCFGHNRNYLCDGKWLYRYDYDNRDLCTTTHIRI